VFSVRLKLNFKHYTNEVHISNRKIRKEYETPYLDESLYAPHACLCYHFNPPSHTTISVTDGGDYIHASAVLFPGESGPGTHWIGGLDGSQSRSGPITSPYLSLNPGRPPVAVIVTKLSGINRELSCNMEAKKCHDEGLSNIKHLYGHVYSPVAIVSATAMWHQH
jgi:hypothetical protein